MTGSQTSVPASAGGVRSSTQRPGARRTATAAFRTPPAARRHAVEGLESPGTISAPRARGERPAGALRISGLRAAASCIRSRVSYNQRSVASPAAPRRSANTATPNSTATRPYGLTVWRHTSRGLPIAPTVCVPATSRSSSAPSDHGERGQIPAAGRAATAPTTSHPSRSSSGASAASPVQRTATSRRNRCSVAAARGGAVARTRGAVA